MSISSFNSIWGPSPILLHLKPMHKIIMKTLARVFFKAYACTRQWLVLWFGITSILVLTTTTARANPIILQPNNTEAINLTPMTSYYLDDTAEMTIEDAVIIPGQFAPVETKYIDFGVGTFRTWLKLSVYNPAQDEQIWRLDLGRPYTQDLDVYMVRNNSPPEHILRHEIADAFGKRPINTLTLMVDVSLPPAEVVDIYIGYRSLSTTSLPITIGRPEAIVEQRAWEGKIDALVNGALVSMILLAALMLPFTGWRLSLAFASYILAGMLYVAHADGYTFKYLWPNWPGGNDGLNLVFMLLMTACGFNFARILFGFSKSWPAYNRFMLGYIMLALIFACLAVPFIRSYWLMLIGYAFVPLGALIQPITGLLAYRRDYLGAGPFIAGAIFVLASLVYAAMAHLSPGAYNLDRTLDVGHLALLGECFAFAGAIVVRLLGVQRERDAAMSAKLVAVQEKLAMSSTLRETQKQYTQARELSRQRKDQLSSVSHDLQQPLLSLRRTITDLAIDNDEAGNQMHSALDYLEQLARDQIKADQSPPPKTQSDGSTEVFPVSVIQNNVYEMFKGEAHSKGLDLRIHTLDDLVQADAVSLMRVISNLTHNAICHTDKGGVLIGVRRRADYIIIEIYDTGAGMNEAEMKGLMRRHIKGDKSGGSGLGLDIVRDISARHDLNFRLLSTPGRGTCARIDVPRHR